MRQMLDTSYSNYKKISLGFESLLRYQKLSRYFNELRDNFFCPSYIKRWRSCETNRERLDGNNGLLLTPHVQYLCDEGLDPHFGDELGSQEGV